MKDQVYKKVGRKYIPIGYSDGWTGFPADGICHTAKITGGDMETFLGGIFLSAEMTYKCGNMKTVSTHTTTYEDEE